MSAVALSFRSATVDDLVAIVSLLADDPLGSGREEESGAGVERYRAAFHAIAGDANHQILVCEREETLVGVLQLSFIPHLTYVGGWRAQIEGVRVREDMRSEGVGRALLGEAIKRARARGCHLVQLTTDKRRPEALRFYSGLGFDATHEGMKLHLDNE